MAVHGGSPLEAHYTRLFGPPGSARRGDPVTSDGFRGRRGPRPITGTARAAGTASGGRRGHAPRPLGRSCQGESAANVKPRRANLIWRGTAFAAPGRRG